VPACAGMTRQLTAAWFSVRSAATRQSPSKCERDGDCFAALAMTARFSPTQEEAMASTATAISAQMSADEWQTRCDLAACYRLVDMFGWSDLINTRITARVPGRR